MTGLQTPLFAAFSKKFDFSKYATVCDVGGSGALSVQVCLNNPNIKCTSLDLPALQPVVAKYVEEMKVSDRVAVTKCNFFEEDFPKSDVVCMGSILHDWNLEKKKILIKKAFDAIPENGAFVVLENVIDDERKKNTTGLLVSLLVLIETDGGFDYSKADFDGWAKEIGFKRIEKEIIENHLFLHKFVGLFS